MLVTHKVIGQTSEGGARLLDAAVSIINGVVREDRLDLCPGDGTCHLQGAITLSGTVMMIP